MDDDELDKSEGATPFKLDRAREKGVVAKGLDIGFFAALLGLLGYLWLFGVSLRDAIVHMVSHSFVVAGAMGTNPQALGEILSPLIVPVVTRMIFMAASIFVVVLAFDVFQTGGVFSLEPIKPDFSRINPTKGFKRVFSVRTLIEAAKNIFKLCVYTLVFGLLIKVVIATGFTNLGDAQQLFAAMAHSGLRLLMFCALVALVFAAVDQLLARREFAKKMRMSRRELKREHRDREGDPRLKRRRRQLHAEFAKTGQNLGHVREADMIIVNPTHYAVALRYKHGLESAPKLVSRGAGEMAARIKQLGFTYGVLIVEEPQLARELYRHGRLDTEIPHQHYAKVASLYMKYNLVNRNRVS